MISIAIAALISSLVVALPLWYFWSYMGLGGKFFGFLPEVWLGPNYTETVGLSFLALVVLFTVLRLLRSLKSE
jgi:hypothetical protein